MINLIGNIDNLYNLITHNDVLLPCSCCKNIYKLKKTFVDNYYTSHTKIDYEVIRDDTKEKCSYNCNEYKSKICKHLIEINDIYNNELSANKSSFF